MKRYLVIGVISFLALSCREKPVEAERDDVPPRPNRSHVERSSDGVDETGNLVRRSELGGNRPAHKKRKAPTAELAPGLPGHVISPHTNEVINAGGAAAGTLFYDPKHPDDEGMAFYLPQGIQGVPEAKAVPGKAGFVFSPYSNKVVDVSGIPPGTLIADPDFSPEERKYFRLQDVPTAVEVPGKPGFFFSPYDNQEIDARGVEPGTIIEDPNSASPDSVGEGKQFRIPRLEE